MLESEDDLPRRQSPKPRDLSRLSIEELKAYIAHLEAEIERAQAQISASQSTRSAAEALFKKR
jgi:uncharacterized small protein (DUF1192 family)